MSTRDVVSSKVLLISSLHFNELSQQLQAQQQFSMQKKDQKRDQPVQPPQTMTLHRAAPQPPQPQPNLQQPTPQSRLQHPHQQRPPNIAGAQHPNMLHHYTQLQNGQQMQQMLRRLGELLWHEERLLDRSVSILECLTHIHRTSKRGHFIHAPANDPITAIDPCAG